MTHDDDHDRIADDFDRELAGTRSREGEFLDLPEAAARQRSAELGLELRVVAPGDPITLDLRSKRMTVVIANGVVVKAFGG